MDPRDLDALRQRVIYARHPDRCVIVVAEPARAEKASSGARRAVEPEHLDRYVVRRAAPLERAERRLRHRYKVPKFVREDITSRGSFRDELVRLAPGRGSPPSAPLGRSAGLQEIAASHSPFLIDIIANGIHWLYRQATGASTTTASSSASSTGLARSTFWFSSRRTSLNLDRLSLQYSLWRTTPFNHTAGGINMNFFPVGPLVRRTGVFFIRRSFKDNAIYKWVLQSYLDYLVSNGSPSSSTSRGQVPLGQAAPAASGCSPTSSTLGDGERARTCTRSRPRSHTTRSKTSIPTPPSNGAEKMTESLGWALGAMRQLRRRYGDIYIRGLESRSRWPKSCRAPSRPPKDIDLQKLAFEVMVRINRVTPITAASLVTTTLLALQDRAASLSEIIAELDELVAEVRQRSLPTAGDLRLGESGEVQKVLDLLAEHNLVTSFTGGTEPLYLINFDQHIAAAFYRNTIIHYFVNGAIAEVACGRAVKQLLGRC